MICRAWLRRAPPRGSRSVRYQRIAGYHVDAADGRAPGEGGPLVAGGVGGLLVGVGHGRVAPVPGATPFTSTNCPPSGLITAPGRQRPANSNPTARPARTVVAPNSGAGSTEQPPRAGPTAPAGRLLGSAARHVGVSTQGAAPARTLSRSSPLPVGVHPPTSRRGNIRGHRGSARRNPVHGADQSPADQLGAVWSPNSTQRVADQAQHVARQHEGTAAGSRVWRRRIRPDHGR